MARKWNNKHIESMFNRVKEYAKGDTCWEFTDEELEKPYLDKLAHQTHSRRILRMIHLAYMLGMMKGVSMVDEGLTPITVQDGIEDDVWNGDN